MIERTRRIFADSLSLPKMMGKGPMITTAPPRAFRPPDLASDTTIQGLDRENSIPHVPKPSKLVSFK